MNTRRDFLAFTVGAITARTVLPIGARAEPTARQQLDHMAAWDPVTAEMLAWWDDAPPSVRHCFVIALTRLQGDMPVDEVGRRFRLEVAGQTDPDNWRLIPTGDA